MRLPPRGIAGPPSSKYVACFLLLPFESQGNFAAPYPTYGAVSRPCRAEKTLLPSTVTASAAALRLWFFPVANCSYVEYGMQFHPISGLNKGQPIHLIEETQTSHFDKAVR